MTKSFKKKTKYEPLIDRYFYVEGKNKYDVGIIMYDTKLNNDNNYVNMLNIEVIDSVENKQEILSTIHDIFEDKLKKNNVKENGFFSDDVNLKVFMDYLKRLAVSS